MGFYLLNDLVCCRAFYPTINSGNLKRVHRFILNRGPCYHLFLLRSCVLHHSSYGTLDFAMIAHGIDILKRVAAMTLLGYGILLAMLTLTAFVAFTFHPYLILLSWVFHRMMITWGIVVALIWKTNEPEIL